MGQGTKETRNGKRWFAVLTLLNSSWIFYIYLAVTHIGTFEPAKLSRALLGAAERPYAYRALVPLLAKVLAPLVPCSFEAMFTALPSPITVTYHALSEGGYPREATIVMLIMYSSLVGFAYAEKSFLYNLGAQSREQFLLPLFAQILIVPFSLLFGFYYDLPQILLVTLTLICMLQARWDKYIVTFGLASLNKETSLFLLLVFIVYYRSRLPRKHFLQLFIVQTVIYGLIRGALLYTYHNNAGITTASTFSYHYRQYTSYPSTLLFTILFFVGIGFLIWKGWDRKHPFLQATLVIPLMILILFFISGMPMEFRVFLDALPSLTLLIVSPSMQSQTNREIETLKL